MKEAHIVIVGAGPAGAATAAELARSGEKVLLIGEPRRFAAVEGISARVVEALRELGFEQAVRVCAPPSPRRAIWNGELSTANSERLIERERFDRALLDDLRAMGVAVMPAQVSKVESQDGQHRLQIERNGARDHLQAAFLVEARGRLAPGGGQPRVRGRETVSLLQYWQGPAGHTHSAVQSCEDGWAWMAALADGRRYLQLTVDVASAALPPKKELAAYCSARFQSIEAAQPFVRDARPLGEPYARASTAILNESVSGTNWIRVGDAAMAVDPLSGNGIFQALSSARQAPAVIATLLHEPASATLAHDFHRQRIAHLFHRFARIGRDFYRLESRWPDAPFWRERRDWPDGEPSHPVVSPESVAITRRPVIKNGRIVEDEVVLAPDQPLGVWHVDGVRAAALLRAVRDRAPSITAEAALQAQCGLESVRAARFAAWLRERNWIA